MVCLVSATGVMPGAARAANLFVGSEAQLRAAISGASAGDVIIFTSNIGLTADLPAVQSNVTILGNNKTLSGNNQFRGLFIGAFTGSTQSAVTVSITNLAITDTKAQGGSGGGGGGGGAGLGGALFVANQANVVLSNVSLTNNAAQGGAGGTVGQFGGGGGMGGNGGNFLGDTGPSGTGGGGGFGVGADGGNSRQGGQSGIALGATAAGAGGGPGAGTAGTNGGGGGGGGDAATFIGGYGGGGGVGGGNGGNTYGAAAPGGFGGGGSGGGGTGGFGGGGGAEGNGGFGGGGGGRASGGFGGGNGGGDFWNIGGGGGGAGMGGAIFVQEGGSLTISGPLTVDGNTVAGGSGGGAGAGGGSALGAGLFLQGNNSVTFTPGVGETQSLANAITDQTGSGGTGGNAGTGNINKSGAGTLVLSANNTYSGTTTIAAGTLQVGSGGTTGTLGSGAVVDNATLLFNRSDSLTVSNALSGSGAVVQQGSGTLVLTGTNSYSGGTTVSAGTLQGNATSLQGNIVDNASVVFDQTGTGTYAGILSGTGSLTKQNTGTLVLTGTNSYSGGTTVNAGTLIGNATSLQGNIVNNAAIEFNQASNGTYAGNISGTGNLTKSGAGLLSLSGNNSYTGTTTVTAGTLAINGSFAGGLTIGSGGTLGGSGTISSATINAGGTVAPGNSIGTLTINGSFTQNAGSTYQVEVNAAGQSDRINVVGAPGTATINGGTVQVLAQAGTYARNTTYTILSATGGRTGTYSNVTSNFAFLTPSLSYDANNVYLLLAQQNGAFAAGAQTANQFAVGTALDRANATATGDFSTVLNALSGLSTQQGPAALTAISGQQYSGFGSANVAGGIMFMNVLGQQMSLARGGPGGGTRVALAQACEITCDGAGPSSPWSLWGSALGATGSLAGNSNSATLVYNAGGFSTGIDYRFSPNLLAGVSVGYASGNQWADGFSGRGTTDSYSGLLYGSFTESAFYLDALAGYAYNDNQMTRQIVIPGLPARTAMGRTGANQYLGQAEAGYKLGIHEPTAASLTPFARFQATTVTQNAFSETGADSLNLNVAQQTTNSVRTVLGAELAGGIDVGWREKLGVQFRLGWAHEYADTSRPMTASFAGAPGIGYTVYGATPQRDSATIGVAANTAIAEATQVYLRYDGAVGTGTANHVFSAGFRMSW